ncbi:WD40 repeat domain-containing serine/threonine protein kinase [Nocardia crassostreae]|uniref:WD40 repeat domain-containing serine/threonine protein kinase n=1 Tax=Nocardia crassostreae TaxID=53428 RepID=UPI000830EC64|nr:serine/threonine-protein kinase [Nocardia crassostreae]
MRLDEGSVFAGYTIEKRLGSGGMAVVYLARHPRLGRHVALKVINDHIGGDAKLRKDFEREAALVARFDHPNIVPVYDRCAPGDDTLWIAMKYVSGGDAAHLISAAGGGLTATRAVRLITDAARGLDHAHRLAVLHRDVKPANLLIEVDDVGGERALVADFGIARTFDATLTRSGLLASLAYTAPERFRGEPVDHRADVYSLGCTLYELLTGRRPFPRSEEAAVILAHLEAPPPRPTDLRPDLPKGLDGVIATAMSKQPRNRYSDCVGLAVDAARILEIASRTTVVRPRAARTTGPSAPPASTAAPIETKTTEPVGISRRKLLAAGGSVAVVAGAWMYFRSGGDTRDSVLTGRFVAESLAFNPAGDLLAAAASSSGTSTGQLWDLPARESILQFDKAAAFSPDGAVLAYGYEQTIAFWDTSARRRAKDTLTSGEFSLDDPTYLEIVKPDSVAFSPDGSLFAYCDTYHNRIRIWDARTREPIGDPLATMTARTVIFSPDGSLLVGVASFGEAVSVWDMRERQPTDLPFHLPVVWSVAFTPDGTVLAYGAEGKPSPSESGIWLCGMPSRTVGSKLPDSDFFYRSIATSRDGSLLAATGTDRVRVWDLRTQQVVTTIKTADNSARAVTFSPDGSYLASSHQDTTIRFWHLPSRIEG